MAHSFEVGVQDDLIIVRDPRTRFYAIYSKPADQPQLILHRRRPRATRSSVAGGSQQGARARVDRVGASRACCPYPVHERRMRHRRTPQRYYLVHYAGLELNELVDHCQSFRELGYSRIPLRLQLLLQLSQSGHKQL
jgi:hypothetical protein